MPIDILMPALSPTMEKGNLIHWLKAVGETVRVGDVLAEIETDKATMEVEATDDGVLVSIAVPAGTQDVAVSQIIGVLATVADQATASPETTVAPETPLGPANGHDQSGVLASPLARRLMTEAGLDPAAVPGTGPRGRVIERDAKQAIETRTRAGTAPAARTEPPPAARTDNALAVAETSVLGAVVDDRRTKLLYEPGSFVEVPNDSMRLTIARRLSEAKRTVPHFYLSTDCSIEALLSLRRQFYDMALPKVASEPAYKLSINDFVVRALALALRQVPDANVSFTESALLRHQTVDIGVAVAIPGGLMTPIVRRADTKTLTSISNEIKDLAVRARNRRLRLEEVQGGTASVSNLGMFGIREFAAIINPPQASILAVGVGEKRIVPRDGRAVVETMMTVTLSVDHRAIDGAVGARLLAAFKALIEEPMTMLV